MGEFAVVSLVTLGPGVKELARILMWRQDGGQGTNLSSFVHPRQNDHHVTEGYCACKCSCLLCCSSPAGKTCRAPSFCPARRARVQTCIASPTQRDISIGIEETDQLGEEKEQTEVWVPWCIDPPGNTCRCSGRCAPPCAGWWTPCSWLAASFENQPFFLPVTHKRDNRWVQPLFEYFK